MAIRKEYIAWKVAAAVVGTKGQRGMTLLEVLFALLITSLLMAVLFRFYIEQHRILGSLESRMAWEFASLRAEQVLFAAISKAQDVRWESSTLKVLASGQAGTDFWQVELFYVGDKNGDGQSDLYWENKGGVNPVVTGIIGLDCREIRPDLWELTLSGKVDLAVVRGGEAGIGTRQRILRVRQGIPSKEPEETEPEDDL